MTAWTFPLPTSGSSQGWWTPVRPGLSTAPEMATWEDIFNIKVMFRAAYNMDVFRAKAGVVGRITVPREAHLS
ncbi:uncharacterized protein LOC144141439 isoform X2 [Haemaphysalis longicornis]